MRQIVIQLKLNYNFNYIKRELILNEQALISILINKQISINL